jgi:lipopolysaccharide transport system permease protein
MADSFERVINADRRQIIDWKEIWSFKELFYFFTWRDLKIKYKQTFLGFLWAILQPLSMMAVYTLFFGRMLGSHSQQLEYPIFVFSGLLLWVAFSTGLTAASNSLINNSMIIKKVYFPRIIIPCSAILVTIFDFFISFFLFVGLLVFYKQGVSLNALWYWPLAILVAVASTLGPGCLLAALNVKYRDFRYVIPFFIQLIFFLTPVLYPISFLDDGPLRYLLACNPMYAAIEFFRFPLLQEPVHNPTYLATSLTSCAVFLFLGIYYFKRTEEYFADLA